MSKNHTKITMAPTMAPCSAPATGPASTSTMAPCTAPAKGSASSPTVAPCSVLANGSASSSTTAPCSASATGSATPRVIIAPCSAQVTGSATTHRHNSHHQQQRCDCSNIQQRHTEAVTDQPIPERRNISHFSLSPEERRICEDPKPFLVSASRDLRLWLGREDC
ncbi:uncharacterized protein ACN427_013637 isoform 1-T1 [Glossina fuscipes fuscipes]